MRICWRQDTSEIPSPAHPGFVCPCWGQCCAHPHHVGDFFLVEAAAWRARWVLHLVLVLPHLGHAVGRGNAPTPCQRWTCQPSSPRQEQGGKCSSKVYAGGTPCAPLRVFGIWLCLSKAVPTVGVSTTVPATHGPPKCGCGFVTLLERLHFWGGTELSETRVQLLLRLLPSLHCSRCPVQLP